jgi:hypothetical protein
MAAPGAPPGRTLVPDAAGSLLDHRPVSGARRADPRGPGALRPHSGPRDPRSPPQSWNTADRFAGRVDVLRRWFDGYRGSGRGVVSTEASPEPYIGPLRTSHGNPRLVALGLNPTRGSQLPGGRRRLHAGV